MAVALAGAGIYVARQATSRARAEQAAAAADARTPKLDPALVSLVPHLVVRSTALGPTYGHVLLVPLSDPAGPRAVTSTVCDRVYAVATGGLCLWADRGVLTSYSAQLLDASLRPTGAVTIGGGPSRTRMSPDGRYAAMTVFVSGHSYTDVSFSTATQIIQTAGGRSLGNLEQWQVIKDGQPYRSSDDNFWGVTFAADDNTFYATLATGGQTYLVRGDIARRQLTTIHQNVQCPSLSPDGNLIAYKKAIGGTTSHVWRFTVLDLATGVETPLPEPRSIDDQVAWLDDSHVLYGVPRNQNGSQSKDVWVSPVPPRASGGPRLLIPDAESPAYIP